MEITNTKGVANLRTPEAEIPRGGPKLERNRTAGNIDAASGNDALLPRLFTESFQSPFARSLVCHRHGWGALAHKNANAKSVAMIDAIAVANAEIHADFR